MPYLKMKVVLALTILGTAKAQSSSGKVFICHQDAPDHHHTISVSVNAKPAHLGHGDTLGKCSQVCQTICPDRFELSGEACTCLSGEGSDECANSATHKAESYFDYDILMLPDKFTKESVTWQVAFSSGITKFEFVMPYADAAEQSSQASLISAIGDQEPDISTLTESRLVIPADIVSAKCSNLPTVKVTIPRTVKGLCIGAVCRPILCTLGSEYIPYDLSSPSFVPSNTALFFGTSLACELVKPSGWQDYVANSLDRDPATDPRVEWYAYPDFDRDGASNIVEYYGIPLGNFFADVDVGSAGPFTMDPLDPDTDGDLFLDGYEILYGLDPAQANSIGTDTDGDLLSDFDEQIFRTNPFMADTDGDGVTDKQEIQDGTNPFDNRDFRSTANATRRMRHHVRALAETSPCEDQTVSIMLSVGDPSGSHSERYTMTVGPIEHQATSFGVVRTASYPFTAGTYMIRVQHRDSNLAVPDYDYTASVAWNADPTKWAITLNDPQRLLGSWFESSFDRTVGLKASLSIVALDGVCDHSTCAACRGEDGCWWDLNSKACKFDCSVGRERIARLSAKPEDCPCEKCKSWAAKERENLSWIDSLVQCPCSVTYSFTYAPDGWSTDLFCNPIISCSSHPGAYACIRKSTGSHGNQCCYSSTGAYIAAGEGAGTPDIADSLWDHYHKDNVPYENCCKKCEILAVCSEYLGGVNEAGVVVDGARQDKRGCI